MEQTAELNGVNVSKMLAFKNMCQEDATKGDNNPKLVANWIGGCRSRVEFKNGARRVRYRFNRRARLLPRS
jgi:hypothetical protein